MQPTARLRAFGLARRLRLAGSAGLLACAAWALPVQAQTVQLDPSAAIQCLTPLAEQRGEPVYPFDAWKYGERGRVLVELAFSSPVAQPEVAVLQSEGGAAFVAAVRKHVAEWRVPCLQAAGGTARLQLDFVFMPDQRRVYSSEPVDQQEGRRRMQLSCLRNTQGGELEYPRRALRAGVEGRLLARLRFFDANQPPEIELFHRPSATLLAAPVRDWVQHYRMPCFEGPAPISVSMEFVYRIAGSGAFGFRPLDLRQWLLTVRGLEKQTLSVDTSTMGCPFDLKVTYLQPFLPNSVSEVGDRQPSRRPLLQWLAAQQLDLKGELLDAVFADTANLTVPCMKIDLKPKEQT